MSNVVAKVRLVEGHVGFYDDLSGVSLNWSHPVANVYLGSDLTRLRKAVKHRKIRVIEGSLGTSKTFKQVLMEAKSRRTGIALETLMGHTPLAQEPTEVIDSDDELHKEEPVETIEADAPKTVLKSAPKKPAPVEEVEEEAHDVAAEPEEEVAQLVTTPKSVRSLKVGASKKITVDPIASGVTVIEGAEFVTAELADDGASFTLVGIAPGNAKVEVTPGVKMCEGTVLSVTVVEA